MVAPLFLPKDISDTIQHENPAVVRVVLLRVVLPYWQFDIFLVEHFSKFYCVFEYLIIVIVLLLMPDAIVHYNWIVLEDGKIPVTFVVDGHDEHVILLQILFPQ